MNKHGQTKSSYNRSSQTRKRQNITRDVHKEVKKKVIENNQLTIPSHAGNSTPLTSSSTGNSTPSTSFSKGNSTSSTSSHAARSNDTYVYGVGLLAVLAIGVCVFFTYNTSQAENKKQAHEKQNQPPKRRHIL